jgi:hypothetical protein
MKAITVRQPWAWAIAAGAKTVENRTRGSAYRGPLAIHAGLGWSYRGADDPRVLDVALSQPDVPGGIHQGRPRLHPDGSLHAGGRPFVFGAVLAVAQLVDAHPDLGCCRPWGESQYTEAGGTTRTVIHHLVLTDIHVLSTPLPARGALGLWTPDPDLHDALTGALPTPARS